MDTFSFIVAGIMVYMAVAVFIGSMIYQITGWFRAPKSSLRLGSSPGPRQRLEGFLRSSRTLLYFPNLILLIRLPGSLP